MDYKQTRSSEEAVPFLSRDQEMPTILHDNNGVS